MKNKGDPLCYEVELIESNSKFAHVRFKDGKECTVSIKDLAPKPFQGSATDSNALQTSVPNDNTEIEIPTNLDEQQPEITSNLPFGTCQLTPLFCRPFPILLKFGMFVGLDEKMSHTKFQVSKSNSF